MILSLLFISGGEIFFVLFIVVLLFGTDKIPTIARDLGTAIRKFRETTDDIKREVMTQGNLKDVSKEIKSIKSDTDKIKKSITKDLDDVAGTFKRGGF